MFLSSKRFWKRLGYTAAILVAIVLVLYGCVSLWANRRLAPRLAKLRAAGQPTSIAELAPQPAEGSDAQEILTRIQPAIKASTKDYANFYQSEIGKEYEQAEDSGTIPSPAAIAAIQSILDRYPEVFTGLEQACAADYYHPALDYSVDQQAFLAQLIDEAADLRQCARMLDWRARVALNQGDSETALQTGLLTLKISRLQDQRPAIVNGLVAAAIRGLACNILNNTLRSQALSPEQHAELDRELATHDNLDWFRDCLKSERALNLSAAAELFRDVPMTWVGTLFQADVIDYYDALLPLAAKPFYLSHHEVHALSGTFHSTPISNTLIELLFPAMQAALEAVNRDLVNIRCLRVLSALHMYETEHGERAEGLEQLPLYAAKIEDPFSGEPLRLKWTDAGWVIYSVGQNGIDDGGRLAKQEDSGLAPGSYRK